MTDGNLLDISSILIAAFVQQCSEPFNCGMHPIEDPSGEINTVFCEDGFAYLSPEPPDEIILPKFDRKIHIKSKCQNETRKNKKTNQNQKNKEEKIEEDDRNEDKITKIEINLKEEINQKEEEEDLNQESRFKEEIINKEPEIQEENLIQESIIKDILYSKPENEDINQESQFKEETINKEPEIQEENVIQESIIKDILYSKPENEEEDNPNQETENKGEQYINQEKKDEESLDKTIDAKEEENLNQDTKNEEEEQNLNQKSIKNEEENLDKVIDTKEEENLNQDIKNEEEEQNLNQEDEIKRDENAIQKTEITDNEVINQNLNKNEDEFFIQNKNEENNEPDQINQENNEPDPINQENNKIQSEENLNRVYDDEIEVIEQENKNEEEKIEEEEEESNENDQEDEEVKKLQVLTDEIKSLTERVADITINTFNIEWGLIKGQNPYLINCDNSTFVFSDDLMPFSMYFNQILLFIGYESALTVTPGQCITPNKKCIGSQLSVNRQKFEIVQIQKYFQPIINNSNSKNYNDDIDEMDVNDVRSCTTENATQLSSDAADKLIQYIIKRLSTLFPQMMMSNVPCCSHCFRIYSRISLSSPTKSTKEAKKPKRILNTKRTNYPQFKPSQSSPSNFDKQSSYAASHSIYSTRAVERGRQTLMMTSPSRRTSQREKSKTTNKKPSIIPASMFEPFQKTQSGLTVVQNISQETYKKSYKIYSRDPFPAYMQHP